MRTSLHSILNRALWLLALLLAFKLFSVSVFGQVWTPATPTDLTNIFWITADEQSDANGTFPTTFISCVGSNLTANGINGVQFKTNQFNSRPAYVFDGSKYLSTFFTNSTTLNEPITVACEFMYSGSLSASHVIFGSHASSSAVFGVDSAGQWYFGPGGPGNPNGVEIGAADTNVWHKIVLVFNGASSAYYLDSTNRHAVSFGTSTSMNGIELGSYNDATSASAVSIHGLPIWQGIASSADVSNYFGTYTSTNVLVKCDGSTGGTGGGGGGGTVGGISCTNNCFVSQFGSGLTNGMDASNCATIFQANASTNQGVAGGITAGVTVHFIGTLTNGFHLQANGSAGSPITLTCDAGSQFSAPTWTTANATADGGGKASVIEGDSPSYIVVSNLFINATSNGMTLMFSNAFNAISISAATNLEIVNCTITNLYYRIASQDCAAAPQAITTGGDSFTNLSIHNNTLDMLANGVVVGYNGNCNGLQIYSNNMTRINWGMFLNGGDHGSCSNFVIYANHIDHFENWNPMGGPCAGSYHADGIYLNNSITGNATTNFDCRVFGNTIGPSVDVASALIYVTGGSPYTFPNLRIYNNLLLEGTNTEQVNSAIAVNTYNVIVVNNTIHAAVHQGSAIGVSDGAICTGNLVYNLGIGSTVAFFEGYMEKGIFTNFPGYIVAADYTPGLQQWALYINPSNVVSVLDSNLYSTVDSYELYCPSTQELTNLISDGLNYSTDYVYVQAKWQSFGLDLNSLFTSTAPVFNADFSLDSSSVGIAFAPNLTWLGITNDFYGNLRPTSGNWTAGAFETAAGVPAGGSSGTPLYIGQPLYISLPLSTQ